MTDRPDSGDTPLKRVMGPKLLLLFIVGDILGTGVYALTGQVAGEVGGAAWAPFLAAFFIALLTAFSYLELVTKYPRAAGAALYVHKAFGLHFLTFLVCFTVMCSGLTSASTASQAFAANLFAAFHVEANPLWVTLGAVGFMLLVMLVNLRGVSESVKTNVVLTLVELGGLVLVILLGFYAMSRGGADFSRVVAFETPEDKSVFLAITSATALAFYAMVGFEDSVNMAEETHDPHRIFPKVLLTGLGFTAAIYVLVSICAVALIPVGELASSSTPLVLVVKRAAPGLPTETIMPIISMFAVANSALINMMMASRLLYGMSRQGVLPGFLSHVHERTRTPWSAIVFTTVLAIGLIVLVTAASDSEAIRALGGTTALLLLAVFAFVNVAVLVLRRDRVEHAHFRTSAPVAALGALVCLFMVTPFTGRDTIQYEVAGWLLVLGVLMWGLNLLVHRKAPAHLDPERLR